MNKSIIENLDKIFITDLKIKCIIGINDWERTQKQDVIINIELFADLMLPSKTDRIEDTIDYKEMKKKIIAMVEISQFNLVERLAAEIAAICLANKSVKAVNVKIDKPGALKYAKSVGVEIFRIQSDG